MLVGREVELRELEDAISQARAGRASVTVLHGDAGIGKSALLAAVTGQGLEPSDAAHDQPAGHLLGLAATGERDEGDLGDLGVLERGVEGVAVDPGAGASVRYNSSSAPMT